MTADPAPRHTGRRRSTWRNTMLVRLLSTAMSTMTPGVACGKRRLLGSGNRRAPQHGIAAVENGRFSRGYPPGRAAQLDPQLVSFEHGHAVVHLAVGAKLDRALHWRLRRLAAGPHLAD